MARIRMHPAFERLSGAIGGFVFRHLRGRTFVSRKADGASPPSEAQVAQREKFRVAAIYGQLQNDSADGVAYYEAIAQERQLSVYNTAISDFLHPPEILSIDADDYSGLTGDPIRVVARDNVGVTRVEVSVKEPDGTVIETGEATLDGHQWVYTAQENVEATPTVLIEVTAFDRPGNSTTGTEEVDLS